MKMKILIMGLPGAGKTTLAKKLVNLINAEWLNADDVRKKANDWDFSPDGRVRQALRMAKLADELKLKKYDVVADFICPTEKSMKLFNPDFVVWMDTISEGRYDDTNKLFTEPKKYDVRVTEKNSEKWVKIVYKKISEKKYV